MDKVLCIQNLQGVSQLKNNIRMIEQGRAAFAYEKAKEGIEKSRDKDLYVSYVKKIPMLIKTNGLGQTLAFMKSKGKEYDEIYNQIDDWLCQEQNAYLLADAKGEGLTEKIISIDSSVYRQITTEVLTFLNWLRRFAEGIVKDG